MLGKVLLDRVVNSLDEHVVKPRPLQQVRHRGGVAEWVDGPAAPRLHTCTEKTPRLSTRTGNASSQQRAKQGSHVTQVFLQPLVSLHQLIQHSEVMRVCLVGHHPATRYQLQLPRLHQAGQSHERKQKTGEKMASNDENIYFFNYKN